MKSFIRARVFKSYDVEVSSPRMLKSASELQPLSGHIEFLKGDLPQIVEGEELPSNWQKIEVPLGFQEINEDPLKASKEEADKLIEEAKAIAAGIIEKAQKEALGYKDQLREEIRIEISEQAYTEGFEQGLREGKLAGQKFQEEGKQLLDLALKAYQKELAKVEDDLINLSIKIAERILRAELSYEPQRLLSLIKSLTLIPHERSGWRLHISSQDASWLKELQPDHQLGIPLVEEEGLDKGDCYLECEEGIYDARLDNQLAVIEEVLREELKCGGGLEQVIK